MKSLITANLLMLFLSCKGDVSESKNHKLPLGSVVTIPSPAQSLLPPTFENPIKDYTVGLVPPLLDSIAPKTDTEPDHHHHHVHAPVHQKTTHNTAGLITPVEPSRTIADQQRSGHSIGTSAIHHQVHHSTNLVQPQAYQPKTVVYQQPNTNANHHHYHQQPKSSVITPLVQQRRQYSVPTPVQYYAPASPSTINQYSAYSHYASAPVHRAPPVAAHGHSSVQQSALVSQPVSSYGVRQIQSYPSISYATSLPQYGLTLRDAHLEPELIYIISEVLGRYHA